MTDSKIVYDTLQNKRLKKHTLIGDMADTVWNDIEHLNEQGWHIKISKVKAHTDDEDIANGRITRYDQIGNDIADHYALHGALINEAPETVTNIINMIDATAWTIQNRLIAICQNYLEHDPHEPKNARIYKGSHIDKRIEGEFGHAICIDPKNPKHLSCGACGQTWTTKNKIKMLHECPGASIWGKPPDNPDAPWLPARDQPIIHNGKVLDKSHKLAWIRGILYCNKCGTYTRNRVCGLAKPCRMKCTAASQRVLKDINNGLCPSKSIWPLPEGAMPPAAIMLWLEQRCLQPITPSPQ
jgi:hypothetical protein